MSKKKRSRAREEHAALVHEARASAPTLGDTEAPSTPPPAGHSGPSSAVPPAGSGGPSSAVPPGETPQEPVAERPRAPWQRAEPAVSAETYAEDVTITEAVVPPAPVSMYDAAKEVLSTDHFTKTWSRDALRSKVEDVDDMGFDRRFVERMAPALDFLHDRWFRMETSGVSTIPKTGPCLFVANHSGTLPVDGLMLRIALEKATRGAGHDADVPDFRWLAEDDVFHFPFIGPTLTRLGAVRACQENAERLLARGLRVGVFPEGLKGIGKLFRDRYQLQRFGRGGFVKLALRTGTPIVPVSIVGSEETQPMLARLTFLAKLAGLPYVPVTPTFPLLGPAGLLPAPTKWSIAFGEPIDLSAHGAEAASDDLLVSQLSERVRSEIQATLDRAIAARKSVFFG